MKHPIIALTQLRIAGILVLISMTMMGCHPASPSLPPSTTSIETPLTESSVEPLPADSPESFVALPEGSLPCGVGRLRWGRQIFKLDDYPACQSAFPSVSIYCMDDHGQWESGYLRIEDISANTRMITVTSRRDGICGVFPYSDPREALAALYKATGGENWNRQDGWLSNQLVCDWENVECIDGQVTGLDLSWNNLEGRLPPEIGRLTSLRVLRLGDNQLTQVPPEIGQLGKLTELDLAGNRLVALPPEIGRLASLKKLMLADNQLSELPVEIAQMDGLEELNVYRNQLTTLPPEISRMADLQELIVGNNPLSEVPPEICQSSLSDRMPLGFCREAPGLPSTLANLSPGLAVVGLDPVDWDDVWIFTGSGKPQRILSECCPSIRRDINADRLQVLYASGLDIWLLDTLSGEAQNITQTADEAEDYPQWWPGRADGFICGSQLGESGLGMEDKGYLTFVGFDGHKSVHDDQNLMQAVAPSPDGRTIAYSSPPLSPVHPWTFWLYREGEGSRQVNLADLGLAKWAIVQDISWSPDGKQLGIAALVEKGGDVWEGGIALLDLERGTSRVLQILYPILGDPWGLSRSAPVWSPDSEWLVFHLAINNPGSPSLWYANASEVRPLPTKDIHLTGRPAISPDGAWIVQNSQEGPLFIRVGGWALTKWESDIEALGWGAQP